MRHKIYLSLVVAFMLSLALTVNIALAQEPVNTFIDDELATDEFIVANDLGITEPGVLPDSPWYGLKKFWENIKDTFVFNPIVKAERSLDRASERLIEMQKLVDEGKIDNDKVIENYEKHIDKIKDRIEKLEDVHSDKAEKFLDKFAEYQIKHRIILEKLEDNSNNSENIILTKEKAIEALIVALEKTDNEKIQARLEQAIAKVNGSDLRQFKNLEVLKALEEKVSDQALPAIIKVQARLMERFKDDINNLPSEIRGEKFERYLEKARGDDDKQLEIITDLEAETDVSSEIRIRTKNVKEEIKNRIRMRLEEANKDSNDDNEDVDDSSETENNN